MDSWDALPDAPLNPVDFEMRDLTDVPMLLRHGPLFA
jgi:hypothetical protein